jgi:uncharacterized protein
MPVTTSYPGVYIEELPSLVHSIRPAPTSVAVFVGFVNPFLTNTAVFNQPIQLFSFADYQSNFGGFFSWPWLPDYVGQAVYQFFLNGGPTCYVVGLQAEHYFGSIGGAQAGSVVAATATVGAVGGSMTFTALQPVGVPVIDTPSGLAPVVSTPSGPAGTSDFVGLAMQVVISNLQSSGANTLSDGFDVADIVISYGTTVETYRKIQIVPPASGQAKAAAPPLPDLMTALANSKLVTATLSSTPPSAYSTSLQGGGAYQLEYGAELPLPVGPPGGSTGVPTTIDITQFAGVFQTSAALDKVPIFSLLATPGITDPSVTSEAVAYCERKRAFFIADTPSPETKGWDVNSIAGDLGQSASLNPAPPVSINAAVYYPWLLTSDPVTGNTADPVTGNPIMAPPSGFVAGIYGQEDSARGVWKSPAGIETTLLGTTGVAPNGVMTDDQQGILNPNAINCIRGFPGIGTVVFGARTTAGSDANQAQQQWKYVAVRRMALFIEQTLYSNLTWAVFEGNDTPLWNALTQEVSAFMLSLFRQGAFAGSTPSQAFVVQCDSTTTTPTDVSNGVVNILVGFAPLVPAEFVVIQIAQLAGQTQS